MDNDDNDHLLSEMVERWWRNEEGSFLWLEVKDMARVATLTTEDDVVVVDVVPLPTPRCTLLHPLFFLVGSPCVLFNGSNTEGRQ